MNEKEFESKYINLTHLIKNEFDRNKEIYGEKIRCSKGCIDCCSKIFRITPADAFVIRKFMKTIPGNLRDNLKEKALKYLKEVKTELPGKAADKPCPALDEGGACMIYEARPVICRRFGPPVYNYKNPGKLFACELNFSDGDEINDPDLVNEQTKIGKIWDELKTEFNIQNKTDVNLPVTIAEAILKS